MKKVLCYTILFTCMVSFVSGKEIHVAVTGKDSYPGTREKPVKTVMEASGRAFPGDTITIHEGTYREWIDPVRGGEDNETRILYRSATGEKVMIKGSEVVSGWSNVKGTVWKIELPDSFFGDYNPYIDSIHGDWFHRLGRIHHTGEVFLNGKSLYEKETLDKVMNPEIHSESLDKDGSLYVWYCENDAGTTTIWANFHAYDPNKDKVEISARRTCFYPSSPGINFITISGIHFRQAATQWGAPTAEQVGMIATHWNKGWIIENCIISDSKCSGITLGKERGTGHNVWSEDEGNINRDGNIHYIEVIFNVLRNNWDREHVGSHIVRNNEIFNCEQTGICGSMGAVFSLIENNDIHDIWTKRQFSGYEIAGIKFHAPVDAVIRCNHIHRCGRGMWLDWMVQGTRVSSNLFYDNDQEDLFVEVSHGPYIVDNNIFMSGTALRNWSQGGAYIHNLFAGKIEIFADPDRFTPYFLPHSIQMAGLTKIAGGDDRFYNNIFAGRDKEKISLKAYDQAVLPSWFDGNIYDSNSESSTLEQHPLRDPGFSIGAKLSTMEDHVYLNLKISPLMLEQSCNLVTTNLLGKAKIPKAAFDLPDNRGLKIDKDYFGEKRIENIIAGPFKKLTPGDNTFQVW